jgi:hypothetical protein
LVVSGRGTTFPEGRTVPTERGVVKLSVIFWNGALVASGSERRLPEGTTVPTEKGVGKSEVEF